jgi:hypothetical protein
VWQRKSEQNDQQIVWQKARGNLASFSFYVDPVQIVQGFPFAHTQGVKQDKKNEECFIELQQKMLNHLVISFRKSASKLMLAGSLRWNFLSLVRGFKFQPCASYCVLQPFQD